MQLRNSIKLSKKTPPIWLGPKSCKLISKKRIFLLTATNQSVEFTSVMTLPRAITFARCDGNLASFTLPFALFLNVAAVIALSSVSAPGQNKPTKAPLPDHIQAYEQALKSPNRAIRKKALHEGISPSIARDLASNDPNEWEGAIHFIETRLADPTITHLQKATWMHGTLGRGFAPPLLAHKQYDFCIRLARVGLSDGLDDTDGIGMMQLCLTQAFLDSGKYEEALSASRTYYNICTLKDTSKAINLVSQVMINTRMKSDPSIIEEFKEQQSQLAQVSQQAPSSTQPSNGKTNILFTIPLDTSPYAAQAKKLESHGLPTTYSKLTASGNLYLLADKPKQARNAFALSIDLASNKKQAATAIANVARSIRAADGSVGNANAYIASVQNGMSSP